MCSTWEHDPGFREHPRDVGSTVSHCYEKAGTLSDWRFRRPKPANLQPEMTQAIWDSMTSEERIAYNRPAKDALWDHPLEYFYDNKWHPNKSESIGIIHPHRVKPSQPPKPRYWLVNFDDGVFKLLLASERPELSSMTSAVELVEKGSA